ncbi:MAG: alpha-glucosidase C-terminal domain-containing protein, partial [Myxococcales bacterium]|nr:alpha-glucosidase C-terminal domain-containing protein [Myxococcales bacterium]
RANVGIRRRLWPLLGNSRAEVELIHALVLSLPGSPCLYYSDEIGMGDNIFLGDRDGVRTPMQWSGDKNAGFSGANPQQLFLPLVIDPEYHFSAVNVEIQQANPTSLLWHTRRLLGLRSRHPALGRGALTFLEPDNRKVLAFLRETDDERILVVANLARSPQSVELGLGRFAGNRPVELSGPTTFPPIGDLPYHLSLGPYGLYWFRLDPADREPSWVLEHAATPPRVEVEAFDWGALSGRTATTWGKALHGFLERQRWFTSDVASVSVADLVSVDDDAYIAILAVSTADDGDQTWALPLAFATGDAAGEVRAQHLPVLAHVALADGGEGVVYDPTSRPRFVRALLALIAGDGTRTGRHGRLVAHTGGDDGLPCALDVDPWVRVTQADVPATRLAAHGAGEGEAGRGGCDIVIYRRLGTGGGPAADLGEAATAAGVGLVPPQLGVIGWVPADAPAAEPVAVVRAHVGGGASARAWAHDEALLFL